MKKTLIIHPQDKSTDFLKIIYKGMKNITVLTGNGVDYRALRSYIPLFDRVMIMGHGSPNGLFSTGGFVGNRGYIIDSSFVDVLKDNPDNVYIWCHADVFINRLNLLGFHSGMFVSEVGEAYYCGLSDVNQSIVDESNIKFCEFVSKYRTEKTPDLYRNVKRLYGQLSVTNPVADYNWNRLYVKQRLFK